MRKQGVSDNKDILERMGTIDKSSLVPYYYQLQEALKQEIDAGSWKPGELLPSEAELSDAFGVSRTVIRQALDVLEADAQVLRIKGKGSFVAEPKLRYETSAAGGGVRTDQLEHSAKVSRVVNVRRTMVGESLKRLLDLRADADVLELTVVQAIQDVPVSLNQLFIRTDASKSLAKVVASGSFPDLRENDADLLVQLARRYGVKASQSEVTVEATLANKFETDVLGVTLRTPMFLLSSLVRGPDGQSIGFMRAVVRCDYFRFTVQINYEPIVEPLP
jgi:GntR family transcriptional regulator